MGILKRRGENIPSEFIEDDFISAIETSLNRAIYYQSKIVEISRISQTAEHDLGYDGVLTTIVPFYIQFKRSNFYTPDFSGKMADQRKNVCLPTKNGFFAFELLKHSNKYGQHNAMFDLSQASIAAYVAPLFYKKSDLSLLKSMDSRNTPTFYDDIDIWDFHHSRIGPFRFANIRLFRNSITIPPHAKITDNEASHHYSYCRNRKIGFHSEPLNLSDSNSQTLFYFLQNIIEQRENSELVQKEIEATFNLLPSFLHLESDSTEFNNILQLSILRVSTNTEVENLGSLLEKFDSLDRLLVMEDILYNYFGIRQYIKYERL